MNGFLLDTNVVSELRKRERANTGLAAWFANRNPRELFLSAISLAELRRGIALIGRRDSIQADHLGKWCDRIQRDFGKTGRLLSFRAAEAAIWGELMAIRPLPILDALLAASARVHELVLVTRNINDFEGLPVELVNPFS